MTTEEIIELKREHYGSYAVTKHRIEQARVEAEVISILQKNNLSYTRACTLLNDCVVLIGEAAKI